MPSVQFDKYSSDSQQKTDSNDLYSCFNHPNNQPQPSPPPPSTSHLVLIFKESSDDGEGTCVNSYGGHPPISSTSSYADSTGQDDVHQQPFNIDRKNLLSGNQTKSDLISELLSVSCTSSSSSSTKHDNSYRKKPFHDYLIHKQAKQQELVAGP
ncbi:hypothetical protein EWB00_000163 [Schistosoma japonicum]|uniref:Uncharacterized protein n=1 Tax=Schistosoma japonicum TaxID=6182 RepID=A0A4Z2DKD0_SCHJA|nr:hypothetical protein EWB00_000163 [Schistosoma japonicum]